MIYTLSSFSANGQTVREQTALDGLNLSFLDESNYTESQIIKGNIQMMNATHTFNLTKQADIEVPPISEIDSVDQQLFAFPKQEVNRRKMDYLQAPTFLIPLN